MPAWVAGPPGLPACLGNLAAWAICPRTGARLYRREEFEFGAGVVFFAGNRGTTRGCRGRCEMWRDVLCQGESGSGASLGACIRVGVWVGVLSVIRRRACLALTAGPPCGCVSDRESGPHRGSAPQRSDGEGSEAWNDRVVGCRVRAVGFEAGGGWRDLCVVAASSALDRGCK
jgi:hypothetical protein